MSIEFSRSIFSLIIYGKGKAMSHLCTLLEVLQMPYLQMDDQDADLEQIQQADIIIATPGIKLGHRLYREYQTKILSELSFLGRLIQDGYLPRYAEHVRTIGITGTNGKSTTSWMCYQMLQKLKGQKAEKLKSGDKVYEPLSPGALEPFSLGANIHIGGNFDKPLSGIIADIIAGQQTDRDHIIVLEVSSFMLWKLQYFHFDVGVFLNLARDHQDRHRDMDDYLHAKANILSHATIAITSAALKFQLPHSESYLVYDDYPLDNSDLTGEHNKRNAGAVDMILRHLCRSYNESYRSTITGLPHRLQHVALIDGITIIDDGGCTSAHSLLTAILAQTEPFVLLCGGYDNSDDYTTLHTALLQHRPSIVVYGQIAPHIYPLAKSLGLDCVMIDTLQAGFDTCLEIAKKSSLTRIVFSPGAKSFDLFDNYYQRMEAFEKLVEDRKE